MNIDWSKAPEGATHYSKRFGEYYKAEDGFLLNYLADESRWIVLIDWSISALESPHFEMIERPKTLTQAVFDGLPSEYRWAVTDFCGEVFALSGEKPELNAQKNDWYFCGKDYLLILCKYGDATDWQNSLIERQDVSGRVEQLRSVEAARKHSHYFKDVSGVDQIDVYAVLRLFEVTDPCLQHIVKKALCAGKRGAKNWAKDVQEIADTANRLIELEQGK